MPLPSLAPDLNDTTEVQAFIAEIRGHGVTVIVIDSNRLRGNSALVEAADTVIDFRDGDVKFLKKRNETPDAAADEYFIWSNEHRAWWRAGARGYSQGLREAGRYTREQAMRICRDAIFTSLHVGMLSEFPVRVTDVTDFLKGQVLPASIFTGEG
jgi:hypothetical protein